MGHKKEERVSDEKKSGLDRVLDELKDPWDWAAAFVGAAGGAYVTVHTGGLDLGHAIPTGALGAISARRAGVASLRRPFLGKKAARLYDILSKDNRYLDLKAELADYMFKWKQKIVASDQFEKKIDQISAEDSERKRAAALEQMHSASPKVPPALPPSPPSPSEKILPLPDRTL